MARVVCECGESFLPYVLNDVPRTACPFCRRPISVDQSGKPSDTKPAPPPPLRQRASTSARPSVAAYGYSTPAAKAKAIAVQVEEARVQANGPARFISLDAIEQAAVQLKTFVTREKQKRTHPLQCPQGFACIPSQCSRAIRCGALPSTGASAWFVWGWTLGAMGGVAAFFAIVMTILYFVERANINQARAPNYLLLAAIVVSHILVAGLIGFSIASWFRHCRMRHLRALAEATQQLGLTFLPLVRVPEPMASMAFPVIRPSAAVGIWGNTDPGRVELAGSGLLAGNEVHLAHFHFHYDPRDHTPMGSFLKVAQAIAKPGMAFQRQETWRLAILAMFGETIARTPDFLIIPNTRDVEALYVKRQFSSRVVTLTDCRDRYLMAMPDASHGKVLSRELIELLAKSPGWSIQLVGGRLMVWKGVRHSKLPHQLPKSTDDIIELLQFASYVRQLLIRQSLVS